MGERSCDSASALSKSSTCACSSAAFLKVHERHFIAALLYSKTAKGIGGGAVCRPERTFPDRPAAAMRIISAKLREQQAQGSWPRRYHERLSVERLARELNVSYSSFRQAFKAQTVRSSRSAPQDFLVNTPKSVGEIAEILGFDSAFHLSKTSLRTPPGRLKRGERG